MAKQTVRRRKQTLANVFSAPIGAEEEFYVDKSGVPADTDEGVSEEDEFSDAQVEQSDDPSDQVEIPDGFVITNQKLVRDKTGRATVVVEGTIDDMAGISKVEIRVTPA